MDLDQYSLFQQLNDLINTMPNNQNTFNSNLINNPVLYQRTKSNNQIFKISNIGQTDVNMDNVHPDNDK